MGLLNCVYPVQFRVKFSNVGVHFCKWDIPLITDYINSAGCCSFYQRPIDQLITAGLRACRMPLVSAVLSPSL